MEWETGSCCDNVLVFCFLLVFLFEWRKTVLNVHVSFLGRTVKSGATQRSPAVVVVVVVVVVVMIVFTGDSP